jgi:hypothetical protein
MQKFLMIDVSELCTKAGKTADDEKAGIDLLNDKIQNGCTIIHFEYISVYGKILVLFDNNKV